MKINDKLEVQIQGVTVSEAVIENIDDGKATIIIPATRVVVQVKQSLDLEATNTPDVDRVFGGMETSTPATSDAVEEVNAIEEGIHNRNLDSSAID